jgi:hypothetical protein
MHCTIDDQDTPPDLLGYRDLNFGQPVAGLPVRCYRLGIPLGTFLGLVEDWYNGFARDDATWAADDDPEAVKELRSRGWPPLTEVADRSPDLLATFLRDGLGYDALPLLLPAVQEHTTRFAVNSIDGVEVREGTVKWTGQAVDLSPDLAEGDWALAAQATPRQSRPVLPAGTSGMSSA